MANTVPKNFERFMSLCKKYGFHAVHDALFSNPEEYLDSSGCLREEFNYSISVFCNKDRDGKSAYFNSVSVDINLIVSPNWPALEAFMAENSMKRYFPK